MFRSSLVIVALAAVSSTAFAADVKKAAAPPKEDELLDSDVVPAATVSMPRMAILHTNKVRPRLALWCGAVYPWLAGE